MALHFSHLCRVSWHLPRSDNDSWFDLAVIHNLKILVLAGFLDSDKQNLSLSSDTAMLKFTPVVMQDISPETKDISPIGQLGPASVSSRGSGGTFHTSISELGAFVSLIVVESFDYIKNVLRNQRNQRKLLGISDASGQRVVVDRNSFIGKILEEAKGEVLLFIET